MDAPCGEGQRLRLRGHRDHRRRPARGVHEHRHRHVLAAGPLGSAAVASVSGATVAPGGTVIAIGATAASRVSQQPVFLEAGTDGTVRTVLLAGIAGAVIPEMKISSTAVE